MSWPRAIGSRATRSCPEGTDTHLMLVNLTNKGITGKEADAALDAAGIIVNKNAVPYDEKPPAVASGIRIGHADCLHPRDEGSKKCGRSSPWSIESCSTGRIRRFSRKSAARPKRCAAVSRSFIPTNRRQLGEDHRQVKCPFCDELEDKVVDSRMAKEGELIRRRRECLGCKRRYTTYERVEESFRSW